MTWVVEGPLDVDRLSQAFQAAIRRRAPWIGGRLARTQNGSPAYELHVPPPDIDIEVFTRSVLDKSNQPLESVIPYIRSGTTDPVVVAPSTLDVNILNPLNNMPKGVDGYIAANRPPIHLHFIKAADATVISISWCHVVMDALGLAQIVLAWENELRGDVDTAQCLTVPDQSKDLYAFTNAIELDPSWTPPGWFKPGVRDIASLGIRTLMDTFRHPVTDGSLYIPSSIVERWAKAAAKELPVGQWVSRNDLVTAWVFKHAFGSYPDEDTNIMVAAICLRGRHPSLPRSVVGNTPTAYIPDALTSLQLRTTPLAELAYALRQALSPYSDPEYTAKVAAFEIRRLRAGTTMLPFGSGVNRFCILSTWSKLGLTSPDFGKGTTTLCALPYNSQANFSGICTTVDDSAGGWRMNGKMRTRAWEDMQQQLDLEMAEIFMAFPSEPVVYSLS